MSSGSRIWAKPVYHLQARHMQPLAAEICGGFEGLSTLRARIFGLKTQASKVVVPFFAYRNESPVFL